jgi:hypothetical protein
MKTGFAPHGNQKTAQTNRMARQQGAIPVTGNRRSLTEIRKFRRTNPINAMRTC